MSKRDITRWYKQAISWFFMAREFYSDCGAIAPETDAQTTIDWLMWSAEQEGINL